MTVTDRCLRFDQKIKLEARGRMCGKWGIALGLLFVFIAAFGVLFFALQLAMVVMEMLALTQDALVSLISLLFLSSLILLLGPLRLGISKWYAETAQGVSPPLHTVFFYFSSVKKYIASVKHLLLKIFRVFPCAVLFIGGAVALSSLITYIFSVSGFSSLGVNPVVSNSTTVIFVIIGVLAYMMISLRYFLADYLFVTGDEGNVDYMSLSAELMNGYKLNVWRLMATYSGWILLCVFVFPILYSFSFMHASYSVVAKWIVITETKAKSE